MTQLKVPADLCSLYGMCTRDGCNCLWRSIDKLIERIARAEAPVTWEEMKPYEGSTLPKSEQFNRIIASRKETQ
jgi:hypothetical protein